ncbi:alpha/beta fold hydrolase [Halorientalis marina]|jgi:pimeloyl-ACP methyl ester carboxylesterase|uniref:alpha/beta fold hydrolase n=1 Tax=Halorientalis marina TaxID=2931976 RepID=UPI001FF4EC15|nr:alpha/beta hydrolase [Halorientalis marina]
MGRRDRFVTVDGLELHYSEWGDPADPSVLCVHGLSRNGRDFDPLARELQDDYHVVCPDMPGRGWSEWADDPAERYTDGAMVEILVGFCAELGLGEFRYVGTSMGGGLGMALAGAAMPDAVTHLVINDVSPDPEGDATPEALGRIMEYVPDPPTVETVTELEEYYRELYEGRFSEMTDDEWRRLAVTSARRTDDGGIAPAYDPAILAGDDDADGDDDTDEPDPWDVWAAIDAEIMILRGAESEILPEDPFERMRETQPDAETLVVDCGHAPSLNVPAQIGPIREFLGS